MNNLQLEFLRALDHDFRNLDTTKKLHVYFNDKPMVFYNSYEELEQEQGKDERLKCVKVISKDNEYSVMLEANK